MDVEGPTAHIVFLERAPSGAGRKKPVRLSDKFEGTAACGENQSDSRTSSQAWSLHEAKPVRQSDEFADSVP